MADPDKGTEFEERIEFETESKKPIKEEPIKEDSIKIEPKKVEKEEIKEIKVKRRTKKRKTSELKKEITTHKPFLDREYDFKLSARPFIRVSVLIFLFLAVFALGRISAGDNVMELNSGSLTPGYFDNLVSFFSGFGEENIEDELIPVGSKELVDDTGTDNSLSGAVVTDTGEEENLVEEDKEPIEETKEEVTEKEIEEKIEEESEEEEIVTTYGKVALSLDAVNKEWLETWGKVKSFTYTIKNNHDGTVKPTYFLVQLENYELEKKIMLPYSSREVKSHTKASSKGLITKGYGYAESTAGDLSDVEITISLFDANDKLMATTTRTMDISG